MTPQESLSGQTSLDKLSDAVILLLVALVVALTNHITNRVSNKKIKEVNNKIDQTQATVEKVNTSITQNNGGSSVKDYLDKIVNKQNEHDIKFKFLEKQQEHTMEKTDALDTKFDRVHSRIDQVDDKLDAHIHDGLGRIVKKRKR